MNLILKYIFE